MNTLWYRKALLMIIVIDMMVVMIWKVMVMMAAVTWSVMCCQLWLLPSLASPSLRAVRIPMILSAITFTSPSHSVLGGEERRGSGKAT